MLKELFFKDNTLSLYSQETIEVLRLIRSENVGPKTFISLIKIFGNAATALENVEEFSLRGGRAKPIKLYSEDNVLKELELLEKNNAKLLSFLSPHYSKLLLQIPDFPPIINYKGNIELLQNSKPIAIVGSRNASINGKAFTQKLSKELAYQGYVVISGLARGIDTSAHAAAIPSTIAVIAGGIDHIYPQENTKLYEQIAHEGLIIAESPINTKPLGQHFPQRNRIISGLSLGTLVVEASLKSGSLITATMALDQNREVFAVPGFPLDPRSCGTNKLIKEGAILVESVDDIIKNLPSYSTIETLNDNYVNLGNNFTHLSGIDIHETTQIMRTSVIEALSATPTTFEDIIKSTELPIQIIYMIILELELAGRIVRYPGNSISLVYE